MLFIILFIEVAKLNKTNPIKNLFWFFSV